MWNSIVVWYYTQVLFPTIRHSASKRTWKHVVQELKEVLTSTRENDGTAGLILFLIILVIAIVPYLIMEAFLIYHTNKYIDNYPEHFI